MRISTSYNNFARGQIDHDMMGRYDLPIYQSSADIVDNFITNFKGNAIFSSGFMSMEAFQDCVMVEFKFNNAQQYLCLFYLNKIRFLSYDTSGNFGWVLDGGAAILEVTTPYTLAQCRVIDYTQNKDVMVVTHPSFAPYKLTRVSANSFTFATFNFINDPFAVTFQATKTITAITQAVNPLITTSAAHGYSVGDEVQFAAIVGMVQLNGLIGRVLTTPLTTTFTIDISTVGFTAYSSAGTTAKVLTWSYPACCSFYQGRLYYAASPVNPTTVFGSVAGSYDDFTDTPITDSSAIIFTISVIAQPIEWLYAGQNSLIAGASDGIVAINGGQVNTPITASTVDAQLTSAPPCNSAKPLKKDGLLFYVGLDGRNMYYFQYDIIQAVFVSEDANLLSYEITDGGIKKIRWKKDKNDLIYGVTGNGNLVSCNFKQSEKINGWQNRNTKGLFLDEAILTDNNGKPQLFALVNRGGNFFIECQAPYVEFKKRSTFFTAPTDDSDGARNIAKDTDDTAYNVYIAEQLKQCIYLDNSLTVSGLKNNAINFDGVQTISTASNAFSSGDVGKHIVFQTVTGYETGRFKITGYTSAKIVTVEVLQTPVTGTLVVTMWYLTFSTISGLSQYAGQSISVVSDGGYVGEFFVAVDTIDLGEQVTFAVVGYKYKGIIKSFCLGFQIQAENTQTTMKAISRFGVRCVASAGMSVGSSLYKLEEVQELSANDLNFLPPLPIDGTKFVTYSDDNDPDKFFYIVQDKPLPATICSVAVEANHTIKT